MMLFLLPIEPIITQTTNTKSLQWSIEEIDSGAYFCSKSIALDSKGNPHVAYAYEISDGNSKLRYAHRESDVWVVETVDSSKDVGYFSSLAIDSKDNPHIAYFDRYHGNLRYAFKKDGKWSIEVVDSGGGAGFFCSLAIDSKDNPHIAYFVVSSNVLKYAYKVSGQWKTEVVDSSALRCSLTLDLNDHPCISYQAENNLKYAEKVNDRWIIQTVDDSGNLVAGESTSIVVDSNNNPHISYVRVDGIAYAVRQRDWSIEIVDPAGSVIPPSIALDSAGRPFILYAKRDGHPTIASKENGEWISIIVDATAREICISSLVIDEGGTIHVTYGDIDSKTLRYAFSYKEEMCESKFLEKGYGVANFALVREWIWKNCIPLLLLNSRGVDADTRLQDIEHRPTWYWRVIVDTLNHRFCVQLIAHWDEQAAMECGLDGHKWDYEPIFLYYTYEDDFYSSLRNGAYEYEYCFYSAEHWWTDWLELSGIEGSDLDDPEDQKLYFWNDSEGGKHPVFAIGLTNELLIKGILQWKTPILDGCPMVSRFVGHAYSRVRRYGITGPELIEEIKIEEFIERHEEFGYEEFWPTDRQYDEDFLENYVKPLTDEVIDEWSKREENPFKMTPIFRSEGKVCEDLIDPWNEYFEGVHCVGACFDPGCGYKGIEACYNISSIPEEGRWSEKMSYEAPACTELTFILDWEGEVNLDLHLWIEGMKVCGKNYETGEIEVENYKVDDIVITVEYSGSEDKPEIIKLKAYSRAGGWNLRTKIPNFNYTVKVYARNATEDPTFFLFEMARDKYSITREYKFEVEWNGEIYPVLIESNASISSFLFNQSRKSIEFVSVCEGFVYFCNVSIPKSLLRDNATHPWKIFVDENETEYILNGNETYSFIYFEFTGSGEINISILGAEVIPEFSGFVLVIILAISTLFIVLLKNKKLR